MSTPNLETKVDEFLAEKRIAVAGVSRDNSHHPTGSDAGVRRVWMHQSIGKQGSSVSPAAVEYCRQHKISVIAGACPMMFGPEADFGHTCMR